MNFEYHTKRLVLKILTPGYAANILNFYQSNKTFFEIYEPLRPTNFYSLSFQKANLSAEYNAFIHSKYFRFWIFLNENDTDPIGTICFSNILHGAFSCCFVGYKQAKEYCGYGYMTEALSFLLPLISSQYNIHRIQAMVMPKNSSSISLLEHLNFINEGYLKNYAQINGNWEDHLLYSYINPNISAVPHS